MNRDFKGVWIPKELLQSRISMDDIEEIINTFYFQHSLSSKLWQILKDRGWAEFDPSFESMYNFTSEFTDLWKGVHNE